MNGWLTVTEAAERLGVSRVRVHQLVRLGRFETQKAGSMVLVSEGDVQERIDNPQPRHRPRKQRGIV